MAAPGFFPRFQVVGSALLALLLAFAPMLPGLDRRVPFGALTTDAKEIAWDGEAQDGQWSNPKNWVDDVLPGLEDIALFSSELPAPALIDVTATIGGIELSSSFAGQLAVSPGVELHVGQMGFRQSGGRFKGGDGAMLVDGSLSISGGEFVAPSTTLEVAGNLYVLRDEYFKHNAGTVTLTGGAQAIVGSVTFNNVRKQSDIGFPLELASGKQITVMGELLLTGSPAVSRLEDPEANFLQLRATADDPALLEPRGPVTAEHVSVHNVLNIGLEDIECNDCTARGATSGWSVPAGGVGQPASAPVAASSSATPSPTPTSVSPAPAVMKASADFAADEPVEFAITVDAAAADLVLTAVADGAAVVAPGPTPSPTPAPEAVSWLKQWLPGAEAHAAEPELSSQPASEATADNIAGEAVPPQDVVTVEILDSRGDTAELAPQVEEQHGQTIVRLPPPEASFRPGKYTLNVTARHAGQEVTASQDFTWGVLAMNFDQSSYTPGEPVAIGMAVLDDHGKTVCDAKLQLEVSAPHGNAIILSTEQGTITRAATCANGNVTDHPDYVTSFTPPGLEEYAVRLIAETANGKRQIEDSFAVGDDHSFIIRRRGASLETMASMRIYPRATYVMAIELTANEDFQGDVVESVPEGFVVTDISSGGRGEAQRIVWPTTALQAGESITLSYTYDAPDESPQFYLLGPLMLHSGVEAERPAWHEPRAWQIASDAEVTIDSAIAGVMNKQIGQPAVVFTSDTTGYAFYADSTATLCAYSKTTDRGASWGAAVALHASGDCSKVSVWYDRWTPGDTTGNYIHITLADQTSDDLFYERIDTASSDTQLGEVAVNTVSTALAPADTVAITKATDGALYVAQSDDTTTLASKVQKCSATCGTAGNWSDVGTTPLDQSVADAIRLVPLASGSIMLIRDDISAEDIQSNIWNGIAWAGWVTIDANAADSTTAGFRETISATVDKSNNEIFLAYGADVGLSTADVRTATYTSSWKADTDVATDVNSIGSLSIFIDANNDDVYVAYLRGTLDSSMNAYYKKSTDRMTTWGTETQFNTTVNTDLHAVKLNVMSDERVYGTYVNDGTADDLLGDTVADLTPPVAGRNRIMIID